MGWNGLVNIDDVEPLSDNDSEVLSEVRSVLEKHGALERFGVTLLHSHFELEGGEVLVERVDAANRMLTIEPVLEDQAKAVGELVPTSWRLDSADGTPIVITYCHRFGDHHAT